MLLLSANKEVISSSSKNPVKINVVLKHEDKACSNCYYHIEENGVS